jgi:hypothetical protein
LMAHHEVAIREFAMPLLSHGSVEVGL